MRNLVYLRRYRGATTKTKENGMTDDDLEWDYAYERWVDKQIEKQLKEKELAEQPNTHTDEIDELFI